MCRDKPILRFLSKLLMLAYCPHLKCAIKLTKKNCYHTLSLAMAKCLKIDIDLLPREQTLYLALRGDECGSAMREKLAILRYAKDNPELIKEYLRLVNRQQLRIKPRWDQLVEEYKQRPIPEKKPSLTPRTVARWLMAATPEQLKEVDKEKKKIAKERKKKKVK